MFGQRRNEKCSEKLESSCEIVDVTPYHHCRHRSTPSIHVAFKGVIQKERPQRIDRLTQTGTETGKQTAELSVSEAAG